MSIRIGSTVIDFTNETAADMDIIIRDLKAIRNRKKEAETLMSELTALLAEADEKGFCFTHRDTYEIMTPDLFNIWDCK